MTILNVDLDNTLIYSYKHDIGTDKKCVEIYQGREVSFMTQKSYKMLTKLRTDICFVPTTTRTIEQYNRIHFDNNIPPYALVCNGGVLLCNGIFDKEWYKKSKNIVGDSLEELIKAQNILESDKYRQLEVRFIEELFVFTKSSNIKASADRLKRVLDLKKVDIMTNGLKLYVVPKRLNKGEAVRRLRNKLNSDRSVDKVIVAGDSSFDISMLKIADIAYYPKSLENEMPSDDNKIMISTDPFSDGWLRHILM